VLRTSLNIFNHTTEKIGDLTFSTCTWSVKRGKINDPLKKQDWEMNTGTRLANIRVFRIQLFRTNSFGSRSIERQYHTNIDNVLSISREAVPQGKLALR
jgi:hypothetical protein